MIKITKDCVNRRLLIQDRYASIGVSLQEVIVLEIDPSEIHAKLNNVLTSHVHWVRCEDYKVVSVLPDLGKPYTKDARPKQLFDEYTKYEKAPWYMNPNTPPPVISSETSSTCSIMEEGRNVSEQEIREIAAASGIELTKLTFK